MRCIGLALPVLLAAIVAVLAPTAARADGLPVLGVDAGSTGVASSPVGARYVTIPSAGGTIVARIAQRGGQVLGWRSVPGSFTIPAVAYDGSAGGLSANGATLVLIEPRRSFPRGDTKLLVLRAIDLGLQRVVKLQGDFSFDAVSPDGAWLYLIHYVSPRDPTRYLVQAYDLQHGRLLARPIIDPQEPGDKMRGNPMSRAMSADGRWAYTLYDGAGATPFVHALDTVAQSAHCIDLDGIPPGSDMSRLRLRLDGTGKQLLVKRGTSPLFVVDLSTFHVDSATTSGRSGQLARVAVIAVAGAALLAIAAGIIWARRRRRSTLLPNLDLQSEN